MTLRLLTWNVLHRVHGVNWAEPCLERFPDEAVRTGRIAARVARWLDDGVDVICLQEVSGDQLAAVRRLARAEVFVQRAPRLPRFRVEGQAPLGDASENLVTLVAHAGARLREGRAYAEDAGKGLLAVEVTPRHLVVNTHVTHGAPGLTQLALVRALAEASPGAAVLGDFNAPVEVVGRALGAAFCFGDVSGQGPTRVANPGNPAGKVIDHLVVLRGQVSDCAVLDSEGLSDHHPVAGRVVFEA